MIPSATGCKISSGRRGAMRRTILILLILTAASCKTVGVSRTAGGYAEVSPTVANEMMLDTSQVVVFDVRSPDDYRGVQGHLAGAISTPFESIERQLPELLPYQNQTILVYGQSSTDGSVAAKLLSVAGFRNVVHIAGGLENWIEHGYRTVHTR